MHRVKAPTGESIEIPGTLNEDSAYFSSDQVEDARAYYEENGYVVFRGLVRGGLTVRAKTAWAREMKPFKGYVYRQTTASPELNVFNSDGFVMNPVLNLQDLPSKDFPMLRAASLDIFSDEAVTTALTVLMGSKPKLVQSMYFEGNSNTWAHQDTYYLDSEKIGSMVAGWFALEDILPGAGRFYVYPGSHRIDMRRNGGDFDVAFHHDRYKNLVLDIIRKNGLVCRAPCLAEGDVLFWSSRTIHGSLETNQRNVSRSSLTAHYIPNEHRFLQFQSRIKPLALHQYNGLSVNQPKSQDRLQNRLILFAETRYPRAFQFVKKSAIKLLTG